MGVNDGMYMCMNHTEKGTFMCVFFRNIMGGGMLVAIPLLHLTHPRISGLGAGGVWGAKPDILKNWGTPQATF